MTPTIGAAIIVGPDRLHQLKRLLPQLMALDQVVVISTASQGAINTYVKKLGRPFECHDFTWRPTPYTGTVRSLKGSDFEAQSEGSEGPNGVWQNGEYREEWDDWGFSAARNKSFSYLKTTHAVWLDTDDKIGRKVGDQFAELDATSVAALFRKLASEPIDVWYLPYVYHRDKHGNVDVSQHRERFVRLECGWSWQYPVHEVLVPTVRRTPRNRFLEEGLVILHNPERTQDEACKRNLTILRDWLEVLEKHQPARRRELARCLDEIAATLWGLNKYEQAVAYWDRYLKDFGDVSSLERFKAAVWASKCCMDMGNPLKAKAFAMAAIELEPALAHGYQALAAAKLGMDEDAVDVLALLEAADRAGDPPPELPMRQPLDETYGRLILKSQAHYAIGAYEEALAEALQAQQIWPTDLKAEQLRQKAALKVRTMNAASAAHVLYRFLDEFNEHEKAAKLFEMLPYVAQQVPQVRAAAVNALERIDHLASADGYREYLGDPALYESQEKIPDARTEIVDYVIKRLRNAHAKRVLVVGSEDGIYALPIARAGFEVVGVDVNATATAIAQAQADIEELSAKFMTAWFEKDLDAETTLDPFDDQPFVHHFDAVVAIDQINRVPNVEYFVGCLGDVLQDGAPMILTTPDGDWEQGDIHPADRPNRRISAVRCFRQDTLEAFLLSGLQWNVVECHDLPAEDVIREKQGWIVAEMRREDRPTGPVVRIVCGNGVEPFSPDSLERGGIGGSETAVIQVGYHLRNAGCRVVVYGNKVGIYDGVLYRSMGEYSPEHRSDLLVAWRLPSLFEFQRPNATTTVLWTHDLNYNGDISREIAERIDKVAVVSNFHKGHFLKVHPTFTEDQIYVTRNGIDPKRFAGPIEKKPYHYIYSSSRERGLKELLEVWPEVKKEIPEAVLHVAYGNKLAEMVYRSMGMQKELDDLYAERRRLERMDGVVVHGRLNQQELADLMKTCEAWLYPWQENAFEETYAITAVEAQAAECMPFCRFNGALPETVQYRLPWDCKLTGKEVALALENLANGNYTDEGELRENRNWALKQTWQSVAQDWVKDLIIKE